MGNSARIGANIRPRFTGVKNITRSGKKSGFAFLCASASRVSEANGCENGFAALAHKQKGRRLRRPFPFSTLSVGFSLYSPFCRSWATATSRIRTFCSLPLPVMGKASTNQMYLGTLKWASPFLQ